MIAAVAQTLPLLSIAFWFAVCVWLLCAATLDFGQRRAARVFCFWLGVLLFLGLARAVRP